MKEQMKEILPFIAIGISLISLVFSFFRLRAQQKSTELAKDDSINKKAYGASKVIGSLKILNQISIPINTVDKTIQRTNLKIINDYQENIESNSEAIIKCSQKAYHLSLLIGGYVDDLKKVIEVTDEGADIAKLRAYDLIFSNASILAMIAQDYYPYDNTTKEIIEKEMIIRELRQSKTEKLWGDIQVLMNELKQ